MKKEIEQYAINTIRTLSIDAINKAKSGHPGLPMGAAPMALSFAVQVSSLQPIRCWVKEPVTGNGLYGDRVELWAKDVVDIGVAERYMEELAGDENRGSMAWRCWQIGGYRCGNIARQAFDAARGEGHFLDLLWGGFPGADAPSVGTARTE